MRFLDRLEETLITVLIGAATAIVFVAVLHRYSMTATASVLSWARAHDYPLLFDMSKSAFTALRTINLVWAQELTIILFVWMAKFGAAYGVRTGIHVGIDVLINRLEAGKRRAFILFGLACGALFTGTIAILGANFVWHMAHASATSPDLELPMWLVYMAIPLGSSLMCFRFLQVAHSFFMTGELPHHDHGHVDGLQESGVDEVGDAIIDSNLTPRDLTEDHKDK
jgi:C4-dicarboxylate transporter DctQ subunit